ncbi:Permease of the drug/metabolite transporter (DMT) superfamily [Paramagnetospirillum magnetotacticum MS-1]|uniref:Permease of the drug/metabolite transporter (DMT) superfamily n=1 Tax=Paramagnetospirillum magnetotacticum MS-1 TaxID=272627 RepID=A0A0C2UZY6_PARME|nr:DMT family transporter [Paramagnetospirillum magnetotacticum]KIL98396.1 Permease of the drug/metabolite transporter (DMT) superfamily [Paramagnetospirillum magnetotacticum MS-1]
MRAVILLALLVLVWGCNWPIMKIGLAHIQPLWFCAFRLGLGALSMFVILVPLGRLRLPPRGDWPVLASLGLLNMAAYLVLSNLALLVVPAGRSAILAYTTPLWVAPGAALFLGEKLTRGRLAGVLLGLGGILVLFNPLSFDWSNGELVIANLMLLAAALVWAAAILHVRGHRWCSSPLDLAPWQMLVGLVPVTAAAAIFEGAPRPDGSFELAWTLAYNGTLATAFAFWAAVTVNRLLPALTVSLSFLCIPAAGLVFSSLLLGEGLTLTNIAGLLLIAGGVGLVALVGARERRAPS